jgi:hypothetical protein
VNRMRLSESLGERLRSYRVAPERNMRLDAVESIEGGRNPKPKSYIMKAGSLLGFGPETAAPAGLRVKFEDRPYHFGWVLYAFAQYGFA